MTRESPTKPAKDFNMKTIKKGIDKKEYIVSKKKNGIKYWKRLKPLEKQCLKNFERKLGSNLSEYKKGRYVSYKQALAITYSQVLKKQPKCSKYISSRKFKKSKTKKSKTKKSKTKKSKIKK